MSSEEKTIPKERYVLSLDGGGCRGLYTIYFLLHLQFLFDYPISDLFDLIVGTSVGSMVGMVLAQVPKKGGTIESKKLFDTLKEVSCKDNLDEIFDKSILDKVFGLCQTSPKYDGKGKRKILSKYIKPEYQYMKNLPVNFAATTWNITKNKSEVVRSYEIPGSACLSPKGPSGTLKSPKSNSWKLLDACDASSAAMCYFPAVKVNGEIYLDGGTCCSSPSLIAYTEAKQLFPNDTIKILSIGTGICSPDPDWSTDSVIDWGLPQWISNGLLDLLMDSPNDIMNEEVRKLCGPGNFLRIDTKIPNIKLDDTREKNMELLKHLAQETFDSRLECIKKFFNLV